MSKWLDFCRDELERAGPFRQDSDYDGELGKAIMELCEVFSAQDHSGASASRVAHLFYRLAQWKPLSPITRDDFGTEVSENQCKRCPSVFLQEDGTVCDHDAHISIDENGWPYYGSETPDHRAKLPYYPPTESRYFASNGRPITKIDGYWFFIAIGDLYTKNKG